MNDLQLENIKTGDEICTIMKDGKSGSIYTVGEFSDLHKKYRLMRGSKSVGLLPPDGLGYFAMHKREAVPHFYYSKNPAHIAQVKQDIANAEKLKKTKEDQNRKLLKELSSEIDALLSKYGASLYACQTSGDDQGVEVGMFLSIDYQQLEIVR